MQNKDLIKTIKELAYMKGKIKALELQKPILLNNLMKEISNKEKLNISEQKQLAEKHPSIKELKRLIRNMKSQARNYEWTLGSYEMQVETFILESSLERKNNWNIHNI